MGGMIGIAGILLVLWSVASFGCGDTSRLRAEHPVYVEPTAEEKLAQKRIEEYAKYEAEEKAKAEYNFFAKCDVVKMGEGYVTICKK